MCEKVVQDEQQPKNHRRSMTKKVFCNVLFRYMEVPLTRKNVYMIHKQENDSTIYSFGQIYITQLRIFLAHRRKNKFIACELG